MKHKGSCLCGDVAYEIEGDFDAFYLCHCHHCRKDTGSAHGANLFSRTAKLRWIRGEDQITTYNHLGEGHIKSFCKICGSALPNIQDSGRLVVVPAGSLDTILTMRPQGHIFMSDKAKWDSALEKVTKFQELPE